MDSVKFHGDTLTVHARDTDAAARYLLDRTAAYDLEITTRTLEDASLALTAQDDTRRSQ